MNTKNKLKIGFGTLAIAAFTTVGLNNVSAQVVTECTLSKEVCTETTVTWPGGKQVTTINGTKVPDKE